MFWAVYCPSNQICFGLGHCHFALKVCTGEIQKMSASELCRFNNSIMFAGIRSARFVVPHVLAACVYTRPARR